MENEKRRLMYIHSEDFYFLTYNSIVFLQTLKCTNGDRFLKDYRKLSFLIDFISNPYLAGLVSKQNLSDSDRRELTRIYSNSILRLKEINKLFFVLDYRNLITLSKSKNSDIIDVSLNVSNLPGDFSNTDLFGVEIMNSKIVKSHIQRLTSITLDTLKQRLFIDKGVNAWQLF